MSIRSDQKAAIKAILGGITYKGAALTVYDTIKLADTVFPFVFITDGNSTPNREGSTETNSYYYRHYEYKVNAVFQAREEESNLQQLVADMNTLEDLILAKFQLDSSRDYLSNSLWLDIVCTDISAPFSGAELNLSDEYVVMEFTIKAEKTYGRV